MKVITWPCYGFSYKFIENLTCLYMNITILYHWLLSLLAVSSLIKFKMPTNQPCITTKTNYFLHSNIFPQQPTIIILIKTNLIEALHSYLIANTNTLKGSSMLFIFIFIFDFLKLLFHRYPVKKVRSTWRE